MHELALLVFASLGCSLIQGELYVDPVLPYNPGELAVSDRILSPPLSVINPPPMHTRVFFPNPENITDGTTFGVYYFVTGFGGVVQPHLYVDYLTRVAAHGYVVLGSWPLVTGDGIRGINFTAEAHLQNIEYMKENLPIRIRDMADFDYLALGGHSAGNGPTFDMAKMDPTKYKVVMNLEPVSGAIHKGVDFSVPSLMLGAELANMTCSITGRDFETFYEKWTCPKVMFEVAGVGHCGFLDQWYWEVCRDFRFCPVEDESMLAPYRTLVEGVTSAMLNTYIQGSHDHLRYVTDPDLIPMALLQHHTDMDC